MTLILNGTPSHVTTPLQASITALANNGAGQVRVTTQAPHLFGPGDVVLVQVTAGTAYWVIAVIDATHFDLVGSTFTTTDTGYALDMSLTPQVQLPTDGDTFSLQLSGLLSTQQAHLDRTQYLALAAPRLRGFTFTSSVGPNTLLSVANGPPCVLQTTTPHGYQTGMWVQVSGAAGDTAINGYWAISVVDATHITIPAVASGSYTASSATVQMVVPPGVSALLIDGWGGGGGGEGGGGVTLITDSANAYVGVAIQGGGGAGAPRQTYLVPCVPLEPIYYVFVGAGGAGGAGSTGLTVDATTMGANGSDSVVDLGRFPSITSYLLPGGYGAGAGVVSTAVPYATGGFLGDAIVAPGGHGPTRRWPFLCGVAGLFNAYLATSTDQNLEQFVASRAGGGGCSVAVFSAQAHPSNPSTRGGQVADFVGGAAGIKGANAHTGPVYLGGAGGGGGGAGPGGVGCSGGTGGAANASGAGAQGQAPIISWPGNTGAGGGGGGCGGVGSGGAGRGGAGAAGDSGQVSIYWVQ